MLEDHIVIGVHVTDRVKNAACVQNVLTAAGSSIKTRVGLHETGDDASPSGLVLIEFVGGDAACQDLSAQLEAIEGVEVQRLVFSH